MNWPSFEEVNALREMACVMTDNHKKDILGIDAGCEIEATGKVKFRVCGYCKGEFVVASGHTAEQCLASLAIEIAKSDPVKKLEVEAAKLGCEIVRRGDTA